MALDTHVKSMFQVFDFELDADDVAALDKLDREDGRLFDFSIFGQVSEIGDINLLTL